MHTEAASPPAWWALIFTLVADATLFTSLVFGLLFLWISAPNWPPTSVPDTDLRLALATMAVLGVATLFARVALRRLVGEGAPQIWIALAALALLAVIAAVVVLITDVVPSPTAHALGATAAALLTFVAIHAGIGVLFLLTATLRLASGYASPRRAIDLRLSRLWIDYTAITGVLAIGLVLALPALVTMLGLRP